MNLEIRYPEISEITIFQDMQFFKDRTVKNIRDFGTKMYSMDMELTSGLMEINIRDNINQEKGTVKEKWNMLMVLLTMVNGRMGKNMDKGSISVKNSILWENIPKEFYNKSLDDH